METHARTIAKTISWRFLATVVTSTLVWLVTGKMELGFSVGLLDCLAKLAIYYWHERIWSRVSYGYTELKQEDANSSESQLQLVPLNETGAVPATVRTIQ